MSYRYEDLRDRLFTDEGQRELLRVRDTVKRLLDVAGAFRMGELINALHGCDTWQAMSCVDRLVELDEIHECQHPHVQAGQNRIFTDGGWGP